MVQYCRPSQRVSGKQREQREEDKVREDESQLNGGDGDGGGPLCGHCHAGGGGGVSPLIAEDNSCCGLRQMQPSCISGGKRVRNWLALSNCSCEPRSGNSGVISRVLASQAEYAMYPVRVCVVSSSPHD